MIKPEYLAFTEKFRQRMGFPFGRRARQLADAETLKSSAEGAAEEKKGPFWREYYDSPLAQFNDKTSFTPDLFPGGSFERYLVSRFKNTPVIGIELGGPGIELFQDIAQLVGVKRSVGVTLSDPHTPRPTWHSVKEGDLNDEGIYREIKDALGGEKANLLIARPAGGIKYIRNNPFFLTKQLTYLYENVLQEDATIILQCPERWSLFMRRWATYAKTQGLHVIYNDYALIIERDVHSPEQFPVLSARMLRKSYQPQRPQ